MLAVTVMASLCVLAARSTTVLLIILAASVYAHGLVVVHVRSAHTVLCMLLLTAPIHRRATTSA
jgi:hypothetical protein